MTVDTPQTKPDTQLASAAPDAETPSRSTSATA